jgi:hypothetical protein
MFSVFLTMLFPQRGNDLQIVSHVEQPSYVYVDNEFVGRVRPNKSLGLEMNKGDYDIKIVSKDDKVIYRHKHNLKQKEPTYIDIQKPQGKLLVQNISDTQMILTIDGKRRETIEPGEKQELDIMTGEHVLRTFYNVDGHDILLDRETVQIKNKKERTFLIDDPTAGWVLVENKRNRDLHIVVDGVMYDRVAAKSTMWLSVEFGKNEIEIQDAKGRTLTKKSIQVRPYDLENIEIVAQK